MLVVVDVHHPGGVLEVAEAASVAPISSRIRRPDGPVDLGDERRQHRRARRRLDDLELWRRAARRCASITGRTRRAMVRGLFCVRAFLGTRLIADVGLTEGARRK